MSKGLEERWADLRHIRGFHVFGSRGKLSAAHKRAVLSRHRDSCIYRPAGDPPAPHDVDKYSRLNECLHDEMTAVARAHFKDMPVDDDYPESGGVDADFLQSIGTAFTYQNQDWYGPTYECPIKVLIRYLSATLIANLQRLLTAELEKWCIVVVLCEDSTFDDGDHIYVFSDQVLLDRNAAALLELPHQ